MSEAIAADLSLFASDASGQRKYAFKFSPKAKVRELIDALIPKMGLSARDSTGRPLDYQAFAKRNRMHLQATETIGDALREGDEISLLPDILAG